MFYWMAALDPALTWDERLGRWSDVATVAGVVVTAGVWAVGWLFSIPWWVGLLAGLVAWVVVLNGFVALGRRAPPAAEPMPASGSRQAQPLPPVDSSGEIEQLKDENQQLQKQLEKATVDTGLPPNVAVERRIANCDFHIFDLLRLAGTDGSYIVEKEFENCTIRGPGIITREGKPPGDKGTHAAVSHAPSLYVEGSPDSVLYEVLPNAVAARGVIHLVGCTYKRITFSSVGIAGSPGEIAWWREHATFSEPASHE